MDNNISDEIYIGLICNGVFDAIPDLTIGELFESFFDDINYNVIQEDNDLFVDFTGDAFCNSEPCKVLIKFKVDKEATEFEIYQVKVDNEILNEEETYDLFEDIAFVGGTIIEDEIYFADMKEKPENCDGFCSNCSNGGCPINDEDLDDFDDDENDDEDDEFDEFDDSDDDEIIKF